MPVDTAMIAIDEIGDKVRFLSEVGTINSHLEYFQSVGDGARPVSTSL